MKELIGLKNSLLREIYKNSVSLRIRSECGKIQTRKNSIFGHFSRSAGLKFPAKIPSHFRVWIERGEEFYILPLRAGLKDIGHSMAMVLGLGD